MSATDATALSLEVSRRFDAPPERVFDAWLAPEWAAWLPPAGARAAVIALDPSVGGRYRLRMDMPDGHVVEISGVYRAIERPQKIVLSWTGSYNNQETVITAGFLPEGSGTIMTLRQDGFPDAGLRDAYAAGWTGPGGSFDKLAELLDRDAAAPSAAPMF